MTGPGSGHQAGDRNLGRAPATFQRGLLTAGALAFSLLVALHLGAHVSKLQSNEQSSSPLLSSAGTPVPWATFDVSIIKESSALQKSRTQNNVYWTLDDSGNAPAIYAIDEQGNRLASYLVKATNNDWESLALDDAGRLYIGDVGNNSNRRRDLSVLVVEEPNLEDLGGAVPPDLEVIRRLPFLYAEQEQPPTARVRDFDSEAIFWANGSLYLLTKERSSGGTVLYRFEDDPSKPGDGRPVGLSNLGRFEFPEDQTYRGGTVTAADTSWDGLQLAVLGYRSLFIFQKPADSDRYLSSKPIHIALDREITQQCEGITWDGDDLLITNEQGEIHRIVRPLTLRPAAYP